MAFPMHRVGLGLPGRHTDAVRALAGLPGGLVASGSYDNTVAVWRIADDVGQ